MDKRTVSAEVRDELRAVAGRAGDRALLGALDRFLEGYSGHEPGTQAAGWRIYSLADAYEPRPPLTYLVGGLFAEQSLSSVLGSPGDLKSMICLDAAVCVAGGLPWLSPRPEQTNACTPFATTQAPVLCVDLDNGPRRMAERLEALARGHDVSPGAPLHYVSLPEPWPDATDPEALALLESAINTVAARLVVVDCLRGISGRVDENAAEISLVLAGLRRVIDHTGAAMVLIHHQRKAGSSGNRAGDSIRGHSSIEAALDLALLVQRTGDAVSIRSIKDRGAPVQPFSGLFVWEHHPGTTELSRARFFGLSPDDDPLADELDSEILEAIGEDPGLKMGELIERVKGAVAEAGVNRVRRRVQSLETADQLQIVDGPRNAKCLWPPGSMGGAGE